ncbi:unnamed protein product [Arabidopsis thaliana]|uniref:Uncharacterized protein n=1 Tax=Arabidopsis thaliana TaxID=3702 RepID=A0A5S9XSV3_ARATH|nr:unnamed protein product [Arabidopsis thaliana]
MDGHDSEDTKQSTADMTAFVQNLLQQMVANQVPDNVGLHHHKEYPYINLWFYLSVA